MLCFARRIWSTRIESQSTSDRLVSAETLRGCDWCTVTRGHIFLQFRRQRRIVVTFDLLASISLRHLRYARFLFGRAASSQGDRSCLLRRTERKRDIWQQYRAINVASHENEQLNTYTATDKQVANNTRWHQCEEVDVRVSTFCITLLPRIHDYI